jgi:hypothetical protein
VLALESSCRTPLAVRDSGGKVPAKAFDAHELELGALWI